jgi:PAS domain S-box-containing protein
MRLTVSANSVSAAKESAKLWRRLSVSAFGQWAGLTVLILGLSLGGISLEEWSGRLVVGWPIDAVILACLLQIRTTHWPFLLISIVLAGLPGPMMHGKSLPLAGAIAAVNGLEVLGFAAILRRLLGEQIDLARFRDLWTFSLLMGVLAPLLSIALVNFAGSDHRLLIQGVPRLAGWAVGNSLGYMLVTPAIIAGTPTRFRQLAGRLTAWRSVLVLATYVAAVCVISIQSAVDLRALLVPALLWLTFEFGFSGATLGLVIQAVIVTACLRFGVGPVVSGASAADQLMKLQLGLLLNTLCAYPVAAALTHRWRLAHSLARSNTALEQAQNLTRIAEQVGGIGYARYDVAGGKKVFSENLVRMLGGSAEDVLSGADPADMEQQRRQMERAMQSGEDTDTFLRVRSADGGWRTLRGRTTCEKSSAGQVTALVSAVVDVTDLQLADQALRASESRYRLLAEHSNDLILLTDRAGRLTYVSPAIVSLTGYQPEEVLDDSGARLMHPDDIAGAWAYRATIYDDPDNTELGRLTHRVRHRDGHWLWLELRSAVSRDPETGEITGLMHVARDVTERKAMEEALQRKCDEAEAATVAKSEFLANMSHEIRTPLTGIVGFSDLLHQRRDLPDEVFRYIDRIRTAGGALLAIVNDILDFSKLDAGQLELDPKPLEPEPFIRDTVDLVACQAAEKGLALKVAVTTSMPDWVLADSLRLRQVLMNLLTNAIKFTDRGEVSVEIAHDAAAGSLRVAVRDTGQGIPPDRRGRLFQRFSQVDSSISRSHGGSGLGLAICKHLTTLMGGSIGADSREGEGSVFWFVVAAPVIEPPVAVDPEAENGGTTMRPAHILVVDDVSANRELVRAMLSAVGHSFVEAENGEEAVRQASRQTFDLILMDMQMPVMDGLAASRMIRTGSLNGATPIVALSANVLPAEIAACHAAGMNDHIAKPIRPLELLTKVARWSGAAPEPGASRRPDLNTELGADRKAV